MYNTGGENMSYDYEKLLKLKNLFLSSNLYNSKVAYERFQENFDIEFTHESTAIEGNTLSLAEVRTVIEDKISVKEKPLREIYEVINHQKALDYIKICILENKSLDEKMSKDLHSILMENIFTGGIYRNCVVSIKGYTLKPPYPKEMFFPNKRVRETLPKKQFSDVIELAAYTHTEFVRIHPFEDGNGRTARLIMNYQLMKNNFLPIAIKKIEKMKYYDYLEYYRKSGDLSPICDIIAKSLEVRYLEILLNSNPPILEISE